MRCDRELYALQKFIDIMTSCRRRLIGDMLNQNPNLYSYLLENNSDTRRHRKQLYELQWLQLHWQECEKVIERTELEFATRREMLKIFLQRYMDFAYAWDYTPTDIILLEEKIQSFNRLIQTEEHLKQCNDELQTNFLIETKKLKNLITEVKNE